MLKAETLKPEIGKVVSGQLAGGGTARGDAHPTGKSGKLKAGEMGRAAALPYRINIIGRAE
jgi:hypothetical protein